jgi:hypothetical protein
MPDLEARIEGFIEYNGVDIDYVVFYHGDYRYSIADKKCSDGSDFDDVFSDEEEEEIIDLILKDAKSKDHNDEFVGFLIGKDELNRLKIFDAFHDAYLYFKKRMSSSQIFITDNEKKIFEKEVMIRDIISSETENGKALIKNDEVKEVESILNRDINITIKPYDSEIICLSLYIDGSTDYGYVYFQVESYPDPWWSNESGWQNLPEYGGEGEYFQHTLTKGVKFEDILTKEDPFSAIMEYYNKDLRMLKCQMLRNMMNIRGTN